MVKLTKAQETVVFECIAARARASFHGADSRDGYLTTDRRVGRALVKKGLAFLDQGGAYRFVGVLGQGPSYKRAEWAQERTARSISKLRTMRAG